MRKKKRMCSQLAAAARFAASLPHLCAALCPLPHTHAQHMTAPAGLRVAGGVAKRAAKRAPGGFSGARERRAAAPWLRGEAPRVLCA